MILMLINKDALLVFAAILQLSKCYVKVYDKYLWIK